MTCGSLFYYYKPKVETDAFDQTFKTLNSKKNKSKEDLIEKLSKSIKESKDEFDPNLHEMGEDVRMLGYVITVIKRYKNITKIQKKNMIKLVTT